MPSRRSFLLGLSTLPLAALTTIETAQLRIDFTTGDLYYLDGINLAFTCPVVLPRAVYQLPVTGTLDRIVSPAWWYPTEPTRAAYFKQHGVWLPKKVRPGDPRNAMGAGKMVILYNELHMEPSVRIHGNGKEKDLRQNVSRGCIRLRDEDFLALKDKIGDRKPFVLFSA